MARRDGSVKLSQALDPLALAVDIGSTASRGDVFDAAGRPVHGGRRKIPHQFTTRQDGTSEIDPDQIVDEVRQIITSLATPGLAGRIGGVAVDTFASSLVGVDSDRRASTPCFTYADSRCGRQVTELRAELDEQLYLQLLGATAAGTSTAAWTGMLDRRTGEWDPELLDACGVRIEQMSEVRDPGQPLTEVDFEVRTIWPALSGQAVVRAGLGRFQARQFATATSGK
jgi:gluconokinase